MALTGNILRNIAALRPGTFFLVAAVLWGCGLEASAAGDRFSRFIGLDQFSKFTGSTNENGEIILLSPLIKSPIDWNELIVSWNATAPAGTFVKVEASAVVSSHPTRFYSWGIWSPDNQVFPRSSADGQKDADGGMDTDTLVLSHPARGVRLRLTLGGTNAARPVLKFLGLSFCNTNAVPKPQPPNQAAWGQIIPTPERSQHAYPQQKGWCSPTSLSMDLARWSEVLHRPEMNRDVPEVAAAIYDTNWDGTGNWPFNTAFAGGFADMRGYVTRLSDIAGLEDWIAAGIPVIISAPWHLLKPGRPATDAGHIVVCIGFTGDGDVVINDPAGNVQKGTVRQIYKRADVIRAWAEAYNVVYLVYPTSAKMPKNRFGQWEPSGHSAESMQ